MRCFGRTLVSFCHLCDETIKQIFLERMCVLTDDICLSVLTPQTAIFGCINEIERVVFTKLQIIYLYLLNRLQN